MEDNHPPDKLQEDVQATHLGELIDSFSTAMLVTHAPDGQLHARPLSIAQRDNDGALWFVTARPSGKVHEVEDDARVSVVLQAPHRFVSITGTAHRVDDSRKIKALWRESFRPWFPKGKDDPNITALRVDMTSAEYWDLAGINGVKYVADALKALVKGSSASDAADTRYHGRPTLQGSEGGEGSSPAG